MAMNYDPYSNGLQQAMNQAMSRDEFEYRKALAMMNQQGVTQAPPNPEQPKKPSHLNPKLLLTKG